MNWWIFWTENHNFISFGSDVPYIVINTGENSFELPWRWNLRSSKISILFSADSSWPSSIKEIWTGTLNSKNLLIMFSHRTLVVTLTPRNEVTLETSNAYIKLWVLTIIVHARVYLTLAIYLKYSVVVLSSAWTARGSCLGIVLVSELLIKMLNSFPSFWTANCCKELVGYRGPI